jgi:hypothetical protein
VTPIRVVWATRRTDVAARGYWDQAMITDVMDRVQWRPVGGYRFDHQIGFDQLPAETGAVVIVPGRMEPDADWLNVQLAGLPWCVVLITSDEEARFPWRDLSHPNMRVWAQTPHPEVHDGIDGTFPVGYTPETRRVTALEASTERALEWMFAGQVTHDRRRACVDQLNADLNRGTEGLLLATELFAAGMELAAYLAALCDAKVAPCPGGPVNPDTFRLWEALQAGCVPLVDTEAGEKEGLDGYWPFLLDGPAPFPLVDDWANFRLLADGVLEDWPFQSAKVGAWWIGYQRDLAYRLDEAVWKTGGPPRATTRLADLITVIVPTSPVESNPNLSHLVETMRSLNDVGLDGCEVLICCDGVRPEQAHLAAAYHQALAELVRLCRHEWPNVLPVVFDEHQHQARMTRHVLDLVHTPNVLFVEHDCPLDPPINWWPIIDTLEDGTANLVRFHHEAHVLDEHRHLMPTPGPEQVNGLRLWRCGQWSQRPHLARTPYYRRIMDDFFDPEERWMIEDRMHSILEVAMDEKRWDDHRVWMYCEPGPVGYRHSRHLDTRQGAPKWVDR